jgi:uncharacterized membrane protein YgaE (UPF0421/DUF939 family)
MKNSLFLLTAAALGAGVALTGTVVAQDHSRRADASTNQISDQVDARIARIRADLRLTPEQEKNWTGFESAMRDIGKKQADREIKRRADRAQQQGPVDIIEQMRRAANSMSERSVDQKTLAHAAQPLFASLNDQQKRRLTEELVHMVNERDVN